MAKHEFGMMQDAPEQGKRYDAYEPQKYDCISVDDDCLEGIVDGFYNMECYWHTLDVKRNGLAYCGITLIPPCSVPSFIEVIKDVPGLSELKRLSEKARKGNKWLIHFGL